MSSGHAKERGGTMRKAMIVLVLVTGVILIHRFATPTTGFDPSAMLALGFVVLASYTFGQLVDAIGLPHITGYLIAGLALGPSAAHLLPADYQIPPFDNGVLSESVIDQLAPLQTLAVALIALTAGGELKIESLRRGLRPILGILGGQTLVVMGLSMVFIAAVSGLFPVITLPGLGALDLPGALALGAVVGAVSVATSPSATIAVINDLKARGPMTTTVLAIVVLKDVVVVVLFAVASTLAAQQLGLSGSDDSLGLYLLQHIGGALALGALVGFGVALYLRYVKAEVLLFVVSVVYTASYVAGALHVGTVVLFMTAGFVTANFSTEGDHLLDTLETLSLPVYVVFFTLAGAGLHFDQLQLLAGFAVALVALRIVAVWAGTFIGGGLTGTSSEMKRFGWMGYLSQAGVSLSLATIVKEELGAPGEAISTLIIAGIALNEMIGPVALKVALTKSGETADKRQAAGPGDDEAAGEAPRASAEPAEGPLEPWPTPDRGADAWGPPLTSESRELERHVRDLQLDLTHIARDVGDEPLTRFRDDALGFVRELRREFLRHHRRVSVQTADAESDLAAVETLRVEQFELAEKWRAAVLARAARVGQQPGWEPGPFLAAVEAIADGLPPTIDATYEPESFPPRDTDTPRQAAARWWLRLRRGVGRVFGDERGRRRIQLRNLARYHLWGRLPERMEPVAALYAQAESHLVSRARSIFDGLIDAYDALALELEAADQAATERRAAAAKAGAAEVEGPPAPAPAEEEGLAARLAELRTRVDEELVLAVQEVDSITDDLAIRTSLAIGACLRDLKADLPIVETPDLSMSQRAASQLYRKRGDAVGWLERGGAAARELSSALYNRLALELELHALEGRVKGTLEDHARALGRDVRGRAHRQIERVEDALTVSREELDGALAEAKTAEALAERLRALTDPVIRIAAEAARSASLLRDQLGDEATVTPVLDVMTRAAQSLTDRYRVPAGPVVRGEHRLPPVVGTVEVPFREWVHARIETSIAPQLLSSTREVAQKVEPLATALSELERRVAFNVELAVNELSVIDEDGVASESKRLVRDMIGGALDRNRELFRGYAASSERWGDEARDAVRDAVLKGFDELRGGLVDGEAGRMRSQIVRDVRGRRFSRVVTELRRSFRRSAIILRRALAEAIGEDRLDRARRLLGLPVAVEEQVEDGTFAAREPSASIPMVYRRLFSAQALEAGDILTGRDEALSRCLALLEGVAGSTLRTVAVVGPDGVGKSAFINAILRAKRWSRVRELKLEGLATVAQVDALFDGAGEGQLYVVGGMHWLRAIRPGGFAPLRRFVERVIQDGGKNAFLVRADSLVWEEEKHLAPLSDAFPEVVRLDPLGPVALQAAVLARHTVSGYGLVFAQGLDPESRLEELVLEATTPISRPQETFFRALHAASGGLLRDALRLWLASVTEVDEAGDFVHLGPVPTANIYALRRISDDAVLLLYQIARQGWMSADVCASLFRIDAAAAEARLLALAHVGILERRKNGTYAIALHLRGSVRRLLVERRYVS